MAIDPVMYIFLNKGLRMSVGKAAAQAAHAAVEGYRLTPADSNLLRLWYKGLGYKKIVLEGRDSLHMLTIEKYITERGIACASIIDEGHTEVSPHSLTALGCALVDKNDPHVFATFASFALYADKSPREIGTLVEGRRYIYWNGAGFIEEREQDRKRRIDDYSNAPQIVTEDRGKRRWLLGKG